MMGSGRSCPEIAVSQVEMEAGKLSRTMTAPPTLPRLDEVTSNQSLEKGNDDEEELSDNVDSTKDSREADRILLGEEDEIFNNAIDFTYLIIKLLTE